MLDIEFTENIAKLQIEVRQIDGLHLLGIDPRPDDMRMPPAIFFVKNDGAGLIFKAKLPFYLCNGGFEGIGWNVLVARRIQAERE